MLWRLSFCLSIFAFSACDSLPPLPSESGERVPAEVRFTGLTIAEGFEGASDAVNNDQILAGTAVQAGAAECPRRLRHGRRLAGRRVRLGRERRPHFRQRGASRRDRHEAGVHVDLGGRIPKFQNAPKTR